MHTAAEKMADNLRLAIARVYRTGSSTQKTCHVVAFPGLRFDSWPVRMSSMGYFFTDIWVTTRAHDLHLGFLKKLLGVIKVLILTACSTKQARCPSFFYWFRCTIRLWNSWLSSNNPLLEKIVRLIYFLQTEVLHGLTRFCMRSKIYLQLNSFWMPYDLVRLSI